MLHTPVDSNQVRESRLCGSASNLVEPFDLCSSLISNSSAFQRSAWVSIELVVEWLGSLRDNDRVVTEEVVEGSEGLDKFGAGQSIISVSWVGGEGVSARQWLISFYSAFLVASISNGRTERGRRCRRIPRQGSNPV